MEDQDGYAIVSPARDVVLLGSTGSVGTQAVDVIRRNPDRFRVVGLAAGGRHVQTLAEQVLDLNPDVVAVARESARQLLSSAVRAEAIRRGMGRSSWRMPEILTGSEGIEQLASWRSDVVLNAIDGAIGLSSTLGRVSWILRHSSAIHLCRGWTV